MPALLNSVDSKYISELDPSQLVSLLRILLACEARDQIAATHVPDGITVSDDGEDGRWEGPPVAPYIPTAFTVFQVKATDFDPSDCYHEIFVTPPKKPKKGQKSAKPAKSPQAKTIWKEVQQRKGTFIFFCRQALVHSGQGGKQGIKARLEKARIALKECGISIQPAQVVFLDGNQIADWTNKFVAAISYVHYSVGKAGHRRGSTWQEWKREESMRVDYCPNPRLNTHIATLQLALIGPGQIGRVTGLSGLGKTRMAFEAFRPPRPSLASTWEGGDLPLFALSGSAVYLDVELLQDDIVGIVDDYEKSGLRGTLVVDNCSRPLHNSLAKIIRRSDCKLSLLSLDYVPESFTTGETSISLDQATMEPSVVAILKTHPNLQTRGLTDHMIDHIAKLAQGFPVLAIMIAESGQAPSMDQLNQAGVIKKLVSGHDSTDRDALKILTALSLFSYVGYSHSVEGQVEFVRESLCSGIAEDDFRRYITRFKERRIIQTAGHFIFVSPAPLAVALAADWWESAGLKQWNKLRPLIEHNKMDEAFSNRFKQLSFSENAGALVEQLCAVGCPFSEAKLLNSKSGSQIFRALAEVNPMAAARCIHRVFAGKSLKTLRKVAAGRRNLVWALEKLCWGKDTFPIAAEVMLDFAAAEVENFSNNATGQVHQLFHLYLSGTQTPARDRLKVIRVGMDSGVVEKRKVCIEALASALQSHHFTRSGGVEVRGSALPQKDWEPASRNEWFDYWRESAELLTAVALSKSGDAEVAKKALGRALRQIIWSPTVDWLEPLIFKIAKKYRNYWPGAVQSIKLSLEHDRNHHTPGSHRRVESWLLKLTPSAPADRLRQLITEAPHDRRESSPGKWEDLSAQKAEALAVEFSKLPSLPKLLASLLKGDQRQAVTFGRKLGSLGYRRRTFVEECLAILKKLTPEEQNLELLGGYFQGMNDRKKITATLDALARSRGQQHLVPRLTRFINPQKADLERVVRLISPKGLSPDVLRSLSFGSVLQDNAAADLVAVLEPLTRRMKSARAVVLELLHLFVFHDKPKWDVCYPYIRKLIVSPGVIALCRNSSVAFAVQELTTKLFMAGRDEAFATLLTKEIIAANDNPLTMGTDFDMNHILHVLVCDYPEVVWSLLGDELIAGRSIRFLVGRNSFTSGAHMEDDKHPEVTGCFLDAVPIDTMLRWAKRHRKYVHKLLDLFSLFMQVDETDEYNWNETVVKLVDIHFDAKCEQAIGNNLFAFGSVGSRVSYIDRRIRLLAKWSDHPNPKVRDMVQRQTRFLELEKKRESVHDAHLAAGIRHA